MSILATILPLFTLIALGFISIKSGYVAAEQIRPVGEFVLKIALPALIFNALTEVPLGEAVDWRFVLGFGAASLGVFVTGMFAAVSLSRAPLGEAGMMGLGMSASNSGFMGYPIALSVIGSTAAPMLAQCMLIENLLMIPLAIAIVEITRAEKGSGMAHAIATSLGQVGRNPILIALCAALLVSALGIPVPGFISRSIEMLAGIASPIALFVIGGTVASLPMAGLYRRISLIVFGKLVLHPLAVFLVLSAIPEINPVTLASGVIFASVPMLSIFPLLGQRAGIQMLSASALLAATAVSFATITLTLMILESTFSFLPRG
ncbi:AEC family transporter [Chelativorans sp. YIM 93263]|uniref:AEC family transporter n=1 Tax=Chelativorans sp. YIM 93263 TaxID=2906648 RepID=UPI002378B14F|nr:AEC family transporter [Chelativorans sp. YIM 93263]